MKTTKLLTTGAVATALLPLASLAAIDDQGMQYVSAAEGLHGSLRVHILHNEEVDANAGANLIPAVADKDVTKGGSKESLRLWITGSGDIGNGWATTYYWEVRDGSGGANPGTIGTEAWDVGLRGPLGSFNFGKLGMVAPRMVPGGSLDTVAGGSAEHFASDPGDNGLRFESAVFNGWQVGISGAAKGDEGNEFWSEDDLIDEYSLAVKYVSPRGFQVGAGYEVQVMHEERYAGNPANLVADYDDRTGWRFGARYGQDNWLLGYEYRSYVGIEGWSSNIVKSAGVLWLDATDSAIAVTNSSASAVTDRRPAGSNANGNRFEFNSRLGYQVHRLGVQVKFDKITASAGYSLETQSLDATGAVDIDRTAFAVDAAYHLGLNSLLAVGWKQIEAEQWARISDTAALLGARGGSNISTTVDGPETTTTQLYYRVDF